MFIKLVTHWLTCAGREASCVVVSAVHADLREGRRVAILLALHIDFLFCSHICQLSAGVAWVTAPNMVIRRQLAGVRAERQALEAGETWKVQ